MSTPSLLLLCAGAAASLAGVWASAGMSESSNLRVTPRVVGVAALGLVGQAVVFGRASSADRGALSLALLFGAASVFAISVGAAKLDGALVEKNGPRVVRRAAGLVSGACFGMAALGAASLELCSSSLSQARVAWGLMFALLAAVLAVFLARARYAGAGVLALGQRAFLLALLGVMLLTSVRLTTAGGARAAAPRELASAAVRGEPALPALAPAASASAPSVAPTAAEALASALPSTTAVAPSSPVASGAAPGAPAAPSDALPGQLQIEALTARGMMDTDARGGIGRRMDRLQACLAEPSNQQSGALQLKVGIDPSGSVTYSRVVGGELAGTPLATCLLPVFYKMGFAAPAPSGASLELTLRAPAR